MVKRQLIWIFVICYIFILIRCAAAPPNRTGNNKNDEYEEGLRYSLLLYPQKIDILTEESILGEKFETNNRIEPIRDTKIITTEYETAYAIQVASFTMEKNAMQYLQRISANSSDFRFRLHFYQDLWRILVGQIKERNKAEFLLNRLKMNGFSDAWIIQF